MSKGWRFAFLIAMAISAAWFLLALFASGYLLLAGAAGAWRISERPITESLIGAVAITQPLIIFWAIVRAYRLRHQGKEFSIIGRAVLPLSTLLLIAATAAADVYNDKLIRARIYRQGMIGTLTYECGGLRLTAVRQERQPTKWKVKMGASPMIDADNFAASTGSIGGSQGIVWHQADGRPITALLSFSDIWGEYGTTEIWVVLVRANQAEIQAKLDADEVTNFTCRPDPKSYRE